MRLARALGLLVFGVVLPLSVLGDDKPLEGDLAKLQGRWTASVGTDGAVPMVMEVKGSDLAIVVTSFQRGYTIKGQVKLGDAEKPSARTMDWTKLAVNGKEGPDILSIYQLDGDTLKVCSGGPGKDRPAAFASDSGTANGNGAPSKNLVFKREKDETKDAAKASSR